MTSHVAGVWGALRHRVPQTLSRPEPPGEPPKDPAAHRPWAAIGTLTLFTPLGAWAVHRSWSGEQAAEVLRGDQRGMFLVAIVASSLAVAAAVVGVVAGLARRRRLTAVAAGVGTLLTGIAIVLRLLLPEDAMHVPPVLFLLVAGALGSATREDGPDDDEPGPQRRRVYSPARTKPVS